jgi:thiamine pyrophosphokinase
MKVLVVAAGSPEPDPATLSTLASDAALVIAADGGALACADAGLVPDVIVGDMDSLPQQQLDRLVAQGSRAERHPIDKDKTDLVLALEYARRAGATSVAATGVLGDRLDHVLANVAALLAVGDLRPSIHERSVTAWVLSSTHRATLDLRGSGATVSVMAAPCGATVSLTGFRWPLLHAELDPLSSVGVSNVLLGVGRVECEAGSCLVLASSVGTIPAAYEL